MHPRVAPAVALALLLVLPLTPLADAGHQTPYATCNAGIGKDVVLVIDRSSSMLDGNKIGAAKTAASALIGTLSPTLDQSALVSFSTGFNLNKGLNFNHAATQTSVNALVADGATNIGGAVKLARYELDNGLPSPAPSAPYSGNARAGVPHIMILLTDGEQTVWSADPLGEAIHAKQVSGITLFTVALGTAVPPATLALLENMASSSAHFYNSPDPAQLPAIFQNISLKLQDQQDPTVSITKPSVSSHRLFASNADVAASQLTGVSTAYGTFTPIATAGDDCLVDRVAFSLQVGTSTIPLGSDHTAPFTATFDCDALPAGRHTIVATAYDWLNKSRTATRDLVCVRAYVDAQATAFYARLTNPADPMVRSEGAQIPASLPGSDTHDVVTQAALSPIPYDISALHDEANGSKPLAGTRHLYAQSLSRQLNATFATLGLRVEAIETSARAQADADAAQNPMGAPTPLAVAASGSVDSLRFGNANVDALVAAATAVCVTDTIAPGVRVESCGQRVVLDGGITLFVNEIVTATGPGWKEVTVNGVRVLLDRPELRGEIILSQSYAAASWLGAAPLLGPYRALDRQSDAGSGADAPPGPLAANALPLAPGTYGARVNDATDVDAYAFNAVPGQKLHVLIAASDRTRTSIGSLSPLPATPADAQPYATSLPGRAPSTTGLPSMTVRLLDPSGLARDTKVIVAGAAASVELNVDVPGDWTVTVSPNGLVGDYTMHATRADAPFTDDDDALLGVDAGGSCHGSLLVGPGAHLGTLELGDMSDWYRFQLDEGQILALTLRPGDTLEAADMQLRFYGRACELLAVATPLVGSLAKGSPELVTFNVPTGASGLYRAEVSYVNGIGTYQLVVAPSVAATP